MKNTPLVYILILNWNSWEDTLDCVTACRRLVYPNFRILLIDNGSTDGSEAKLRAHVPDLELIQTGANLGYAKGNNLGVCRALDAGAEWIWILNPDALVEKNSLDRLADVFNEDSSAGICGATDIKGKRNGRLCFEDAGLYPGRGYRVFPHAVEGRYEAGSLGVQEVDFVSGASMFVRSRLFREIGLLREDFFLYFEDVEFSFRAREHGWRTVVCGRALFLHNHDDGRQSASCFYYHNRNSIIFARIQKKQVWQTVIERFRPLQIADVFTQRRLSDFPKHLLHRSKLVLAGLFRPLKPVPRYYSKGL